MLLEFVVLNSVLDSSAEAGYILATIMRKIVNLTKISLGWFDREVHRLPFWQKAQHDISDTKTLC